MIRVACCVFAVIFCCQFSSPVQAESTIFFDASQIAVLMDDGVTSDTIRSHGYVFTYTRDKLFTGGTGQIIGRPVRVPWPQGVEAQAVTTPPPGSTDHKARMTIRRVDGGVFDFTALTVKILASTSGAGASLEIMPLVDGEDAFDDPLFFAVTGFYGQTFSYDTSVNPWGSTALLRDFDTYKISLYVDFAFVGLTFDSPSVPGDFDGDLDVDLSDYASFEGCADSPAIPLIEACVLEDLDFDNDVDLADFGLFQRCYSGQGIPGHPDCVHVTAR